MHGKILHRNSLSWMWDESELFLYVDWRMAVGVANASIFFCVGPLCSILGVGQVYIAERRKKNNVDAYCNMYRDAWLLCLSNDLIFPRHRTDAV